MVSEGWEGLFRISLRNEGPDRHHYGSRRARRQSERSSAVNAPGLLALVILGQLAKFVVEAVVKPGMNFHGV
jgi:hypothetical protein